MNLKQAIFQKPKVKTFFLACFMVGFFPFSVSAQTLLIADKVALDSVKKGIDYIYNFQFEKAESCVKKWKPANPNHPAFLLFNSVLNFWKQFPIGAKPKEYQAYIANLYNLVNQAQKLEKKFPNHPEPLFYSLLGNMILARHQSEEGEYIKAVNATRKAFPYFKKGFDLKNSYSDFYFSTGIYDYYRIAFPENHPLYKPFTIFFPDGNKELGIKELELATQKSIFSKAEAYGFLGMIFLRDQYNVPQALKNAEHLHLLYPDNWLYSIFYAECLVESKKLETAEPLINKLTSRNESASLLGGYYLKGLSDKLSGNPDAGKWAFQKALQYAKSKDRLSKGYLSLCYLELGKTAHDEGKRDWAGKYFKLARENSSYKKVKSEIENLGY